MRRFTLLVADNFEPARQSYRRRLTGKGYEVLLAADPWEAEAMLKEHLVHLAVIDVRLENDSNENDRSGLELCERIDPIVPRILVSGFTDWAIIREALRPHSIGARNRLADGFFFKGFGPSGQEDTLLYKEIERILAEEYEIVPKSRIAVLTSGGDSPGMNAAVWSVVRTAMRNEIEVLGVIDGYDGLISGNMRKLRWNDVSDIMIESGTILGSARSEDFFKEAGRAVAVNHILSKHVDGLVVIGGDGSMKGAEALAKDVRNKNGKLRTVALPGTIDNDLAGTDMSLGAASAANAMVNQVRHLVRPAKALRMIFIVEVMGALSGYLALQTAIGSGADGVLLPEKILAVDPLPADRSQEGVINYNLTKGNLDAAIAEIEQQLRRAFASGKNYGFIIQAEGIDKATVKYVEKTRAEMGSNATGVTGRGLTHTAATIECLNGAYTKRILEEKIKSWDGQKKPKVRVQELGHAVRGVLPSRFDIWLGAVLGENAVESLIAEHSEVMIGWTEKTGLTRTPFAEVVRFSNRPPHEIWVDRSSWRELDELHRTLNYQTVGEDQPETD